jgi:isoleucyl-tRNA synthetase
MPGNRAIAYSTTVPYGLYEVEDVAVLPDGRLPWAKAGDRYILADALAQSGMDAAKVSSFTRIATVPHEAFAGLAARHPLASRGYDFAVPLFPASTSQMRRAPASSTPRRDTAWRLEVWTENKRGLEARGIETAIPYTVAPTGGSPRRHRGSRASPSLPTRARRATPTLPSSRR